MSATFSEILTAVKPKDRTRRYEILAALYCLSAHVRPVTTRDVAGLLKLHLRSRAPVNVSDALSKYTSEVEIAGKGPPITWRLTPKGLSRLRELSGLALQDGHELEDYKVDVGIVCALGAPEFDAVIRASGGTANWREIVDASLPHRYRQAQVTTRSGSVLRLVGTTSMSMGLTSAAIATTQLVLLHKPRFVLMLGIAAGTRDGSKQFGDILVADPSVDYNSGKVVEQNGIREFLPDPYPIGINPRLRSLLQKYLGDCSALAEIRDRWGGPTPGVRNRVHLGPLGASDQVIDDASRVVEIQKNWRKLIGVEMETYAVYRACHDAPEPKPRFVSMKAVCDFAASKGDSWQAYAAFMAAEFGFHFLKEEWEAMWPKIKPKSEVPA